VLPLNAKKVFSGVIFDVYQWEQEMYDGSVATFERLKRPDTAEIVVIVGDKIVIQKQEQPDKKEAFLCLPGGRIEAGEDPLDGAKRELLEETGLACADWELIAERKLASKIEWIDYVYVARDCKTVAQQHLDAGERIELVQIDFEKFLEMADSGELNRIEPSLRTDLVRAKYDAPSREKLRKLFFG